jgi:hypothetical protein
MKRGWDLAYPETSGYIIPTIYIYGELYDEPGCIRRAIAIGNWEVDIQTPSGGVLSNLKSTETRIFNTAQVLLGWCFLYEKTRENRFKEAALRAAKYLCERQEPDGSWVTDTFCGSRTYHARVDWALLRAADVFEDTRFILPAVKNLKWVVRQQQPNGWFEQCGFHHDPPNMHVIAYTLRGLLECQILNSRLQNAEITRLDLSPRLLMAAEKLSTIAVSRPLYAILGMLPSSFDGSWHSSDDSSCLTGNLQFACFLYRLHHLTGDRRYPAIADMLLRAVQGTQFTGSDLTGIDGAIPGSYPIYTGYHSASFPNWATKFLVDAIIFKQQRASGIDIPA